MIIIYLLSMGQAHGSGHRRDFVKWGPESLQNFAINMTCSVHEHETEPCKTIQLMGTEMEFANCWDDVHVIRDLEGWTCFYPPAKLHIPLASHIINNQSFSDSCGVIQKCSTD